MSADEPGEPGMESARPTMRDVAALAGVALKTVSRVINDLPWSSESERLRTNSDTGQTSRHRVCGVAARTPSDYSWTMSATRSRPRFIARLRTLRAIGASCCSPQVSTRIHDASANSSAG